MLKSVGRILPALLLTSCVSTRAKIVESPSPTVVASEALPAPVEKPAIPTCTRRYVALDLEIYNQCVLEGMSFATVSNIIGYAGTPVAASGNAATFRWTGNTGGVMMAVFVNDKLTSKSQSGLEACIRNC
jgi:hypothetical protein